MRLTGMNRIWPMLVLVVTASVAVPSAEAAAPTCRGEAATLVGAPQGTVMGTSGRDVVVTNGAWSVRTFGGDDLVCTTNTHRTLGPGSFTLEVRVGRGADVVDSSEDVGRAGIFVALGQGDDALVGGRGFEYVKAQGIGHDHVRTGARRDIVYLGSLQGLDEDTIQTGADDDRVFVRGVLGPGARILGGPGRDELDVKVVSDGRWVFDDRREVARLDDRTAWRWSSLEAFTFQQDVPAGRIHFRGGPDDDTVTVATPSFRGARLGGGDDLVYLAPLAFGEAPGLRAGHGRDRMLIRPKNELVGGRPSVTARWLTIDLAAGTMAFVDTKARASSMPVKELEDLDVQARSATLSGNDSANRLAVYSCDVRVAGGAGDDRLDILAAGCGPATERSEYGGPGDDRLRGSQSPDLLVGGPGVDKAIGGFGPDDRCTAELAIGCEHTLP
jgi:hypothetical protein